MKPQPKVSVRGLSKAFPLYERKRARGIATSAASSVRYLLRNTVLPARPVTTPQRGSRDFLYALDDVNVDVAPGEVLGIIGRNGAGKSTLLKILARVLAPTEGRITIRGRVVSMLELGIGFAPDLTVRDNIEIYGRLAGLPTARIRALEDEILAMARLTDFRDELLARCPSGSFVQLAFAAMISMDAGVILADEVLTVGDSEFRQRCEQRIRAAASSGEAVLFVSHDMNAIRRTCSRVLWIDRGRVRLVGPTDQVVDAYTTELLAGRLSEPEPEASGAGCRILELRLLDGEGEQVGALQMTEPGHLDCVLRVERPDVAVNVQFELRDERGRTNILTTTSPMPIRARRPTTFHAAVKVPRDFLNEQSYELRCRLYVQRPSDAEAGPELGDEETLAFTVMNPHPEDSVWADWAWSRAGLISPRLAWTVRSEQKAPAAGKALAL